MASTDFERPEFRGLSREEINTLEHEQEREALKEYGVHLAADHMQGYMYKPDRFYNDVTALQKPWECPIEHRMGQDVFARNSSVESWNNDAVTFEVREGIAYVTINRPEQNNSFAPDVLDGLHDAWLILKNRPDIRVLVLSGTGRMFCAGGDHIQSTQADEIDANQVIPQGSEIVGRFESMTGPKAQQWDGLARDLIVLSRLPQFVILCMNGSAMGAGVGLVAACDYVIALKSAHCLLSEVKLGRIPAVVAPHIVRTVGMVNAKRLFCMAENVNMYRALEYGLVQRLVNDVSEFPSVVKDVVTKINACAPGAVAAAKRTILDVLYQPLSENLCHHTATEYARIRKTKECEEGMKALMAKKKPTWVENRIQVREAAI